MQISIELLAGGADAVPVDAQNAEVTRLKVRGHSFSQAYIPPPGFNLLCALQLECSAALETLRTETEVRSVIALIEQCKFLEDIEEEDEDEGAGAGAGEGAGEGEGEGEGGGGAEEGWGLRRGSFRVWAGAPAVRRWRRPPSWRARCRAR